VTSSLESLKKLFHGLFAMVFPPGVVLHGATCAFPLVAVGGLRDIDGTLFPEVSSTASCLR
jgi:hypothetical protein